MEYLLPAGGVTTDGASGACMGAAHAAITIGNIKAELRNIFDMAIPFVFWVGTLHVECQLDITRQTAPTLCADAQNDRCETL
jgi:hypothetical protein